MATRNEIARERYSLLRSYGVSPEDARRLRYAGADRFQRTLDQVQRQATLARRAEERNQARRQRYAQAREAGLNPKEANRAAGRTGARFHNTLAAVASPETVVQSFETAGRRGRSKRENWKYWSRSDSLNMPQGWNEVIEVANREMAGRLDIPYNNQPPYMRKEERKDGEEEQLYPESPIGFRIAYDMYMNDRGLEESIQILTNEFGEEGLKNYYL